MWNEMELLSSLPGWSYTLFDRYAWFLFQVLAAMMMVVDATGLALIPWDRLSVLIVLGVTWFFKFFIVGECRWLIRSCYFLSRFSTYFL